MHVYHATLHAALLEAVRHGEDDLRLEFSPEDLYEIFSTGGISYGETKAGHVEIQTIKGKNTRKWYHVVIYRFDSGTYELTCYVL